MQQKKSYKKLLINEYYKNKLVDKNDISIILHKMCDKKDLCWRSKFNLVEPSNNEGLLSLPFIGKYYHKTKIIFVGINTNDCSSQNALENLAMSASNEIKEFKKKKVRFINKQDDSESGYKRGSGTLFYYRMAAFAITIKDKILNDLVRNTEPSFEEIANVFDYFSYTNLIKCSPKRERGKPSKEMFENCFGEVHKLELKVLQPTIIITFGRECGYYYQKHLSQNITTSEVFRTGKDRNRVELMIVEGDKNRVYIFNLPHPSFGSFDKPHKNLVYLLNKYLR